MAGATAPRFNSREAALRFYFRAVELMMPNAKPGIFSTRRLSRGCHRPNLISDLFALDSCFHGMHDVQLWLLHELYGPGCFNPRPRPQSEVLEALRSKFPEHQWTPKQIAQFRSEALQIFEAHLLREHLM